MLCQTDNQYLTYGSQDFGINLTFTTDPNLHKTHFRLPDGAEREILTGEQVALGIGGGEAFLQYAERRWGINLEWRDDPVFEWRIYGLSGEKGQPIPTNTSVAIINENVKPTADFLVYLERVGADIGWTTSPDWKGKITDWLTDQAFNALVALLTS